LALRAKVVQTVVCSTFTRGAKPATRRVADGERMNPQGKGGAFAPTQEMTRAGRRGPGELSRTWNKCRRIVLKKHVEAAEGLAGYQL